MKSARNKGRAEGMAAGKQVIISKMHEKGMSLQEIADFLEMDLEEIVTLAGETLISFRLQASLAGFRTMNLLRRAQASSIPLRSISLAGFRPMKNQKRAPGRMQALFRELVSAFSHGSLPSRKL